MSDTNDQSVSLNLVTEIVCAFLSNNSISNNQIPDLITSVHHTLMNVGEKAPETLEPAVAIKKSVKPDYIICLEDGKKLKTLKRHLKTAFDLSPMARLVRLLSSHTRAWFSRRSAACVLNAINA